MSAHENILECRGSTRSRLPLDQPETYVYDRLGKVAVVAAIDDKAGGNAADLRAVHMDGRDGGEHVLGEFRVAKTTYRQAETHLIRLNARKRETVPASELVVGVQCVGSDAFSGVTANPAVGFCTDLLVRAGATVMFSEVTEVRDGIDQLTLRAATPEVAAAMIREMAWYDAYLEKGRVGRSANTSPGNKRGACPTLSKRRWGLSSSQAVRPFPACLHPVKSCAAGG